MNFWKGSQNFVGWIGLVIACYSLYSQTLGKNHELTIVVSSLNVYKEQLVVGVLFNNSGDFVETVIDGGISLPTSDFSSEVFYLQGCFEPVTIKAKDIVHKYYRVNTPLHGGHKNETNTVTRPLHIYYDVVMPDGSISNQTKTLGNISHRMSDGLIERIESESSMLSVRFDDKGIQDFGDHYISEAYDHERSRYSGCKSGA